MIVCDCSRKCAKDSSKGDHSHISPYFLGRDLAMDVTNRFNPIGEYHLML